MEKRHKMLLSVEGLETLERLLHEATDAACMLREKLEQINQVSLKVKVEECRPECSQPSD